MVFFYHNRCPPMKYFQHRRARNRRRRFSLNDSARDAADDMHENKDNITITINDIILYVIIIRYLGISIIAVHTTHQSLVAGLYL